MQMPNWRDRKVTNITKEVKNYIIINFLIKNISI